MHTIYPTFFPQFQCKAEHCRHTCCQTWEIDIDPDTERRYRETPGPLGQELQRWMRIAEDGSACFRLNEKGYCHFLREDGLCRLILEKGEDYLGQICTMHPRFYKYISDDIELCGTGLCCEKTCEQLQEAPRLSFAMESTDAAFSFTALLQALGIDITENDTRWQPVLTLPALQSMIRHLAQTEPIDAAWTEALARMRHHPEALLDTGTRYAKHCDLSYFQKLYQYIWYRQLDLAETIPLSLLAAFAEESTLYIFLAAAVTEDPLRSAARWSEQIEYDTDNVDILLTEIEKDNRYSI